MKYVNVVQKRVELPNLPEEDGEPAEPDVLWEDIPYPKAKGELTREKAKTFIASIPKYEGDVYRIATIKEVKEVKSSETLEIFTVDKGE